MKALVKAKAEPGLWMDDVPFPSLGPNDVLVKVKKTAICGTDLHIYNWDEWSRRNIPVPLTIGHEFAGTIEEVGSAVSGLEKGERVSAEGHIICHHCRNCRAGKRHLCRNTKGVGIHRPGAFAEYVAVPAYNIFKISDVISDEIAACFDPLGNAVHAALSFDLVGEDVLITGAGPIGIMAAAISRHVGARHVVITDINDYRLELARKVGASRAINVREASISKAIDDLGMTEGFDVGMEMSGSAEAFREMLRLMNHGGRVALLGIPPSEMAIDWNEVIFKGLEMKGIYGREMFETWYKMSTMIQGGLDISAVLTHRFPVDEFSEGFEVLKSGKSGKVVLDWT